MQIKTTSNELFSSSKNTILLGFFEGELKLGISTVPEEFADSLKDTLKSLNFTGKTEQQHILRLNNKVNAIISGFGPRENFTLNSLRLAVASAVKSAGKISSKELSFSINMGSAVSIFSSTDAAKAIAESAVMSVYHFDSSKSEREENLLEKIFITNIDESDKKEIDNAVSEGIVFGELNVKARELANSTPSLATPDYMAKKAKKIAEDNNLKIKIITKSEMEKQGMNGILAVASGSRNEPKFVIMEYDAGSEKTIVLVGKGVCFDSGGLDIKPAAHMETMKMDKSGAVTVMAVMEAIAKLKPNVNVVGVMPLVENLISDASYKPGDIIKTLSGKTIEVLNTDAEGRIILSDALYYASTTYNPECIIDIATLTGAVVIALGNNVAGIMGNDKSLTSKLIVSGTKTYERLWELPMFEDYSELMKSDHADIKNVISNTPGNPAGTITAAVFLSNFINNSKWAHLDVAGTAWSSEDLGYYSKGSTGFGARLLVQFLIDYE